MAHTTNRPTPADDPADFPDDTSPESIAKLIEQGTQMVEGVEQLRVAVDRQRRVQFWAICAVAVLVLILGLVAFDNHGQIAELKQQMCGAVVGIVPAPGEAEPPPGKEGERSRDVIGRFRVLAKDFNCTLRT